MRGMEEIIAQGPVRGNKRKEEVCQQVVTHAYWGSGCGNTVHEHQPYFKFMTTNHHFEIFNIENFESPNSLDDG